MRLAPVVAGIAAGTMLMMSDATPALAVQSYFVNGLPGRALDAQIGRRCAFESATFGMDAGPVRTSAGERPIRVRLADDPPCQGALVATRRTNLTRGSTNVIVAHLDQNGAAQLSKFTTDASPLGPGRTRLTAYHTAAAPAVDIELYPWNGNRELVEFERVRPGDQTFPREIPAGRYELEIYPSRADEEVLEIEVQLRPGVAYDAFVVGSLRRGTLRVLLVEIDPASSMQRR